MKLAVTFLIIFISLLSNPLLAQTEFSKTIEYIQNRYANNFTKYPILLFDIDEVEYRFAKAGALAAQKQASRVSIIQRYVWEKSHVKLSKSEAATYETYAYDLKGNALAAVIPAQNSEDPYKLCTVFPASPNSNKRLESERLLGLGNHTAYPEITYKNLKQTLSYQNAKLLSLYHELGHCMDPTYLPEIYQTQEPDSYEIHSAESFAETMGLLFLAKEGILDVAATRSLYRNLYAQHVGKWLAETHQGEFEEGGVIYNLSRTIAATDHFIKNNSRFFYSANINDLINMAAQIIKENILPYRSFQAIFQYLQNGQPAINSYMNLAYRNPELFSEALEDQLLFKEFGKYLSQQLITFDNDEYGVEENIDLAIDFKLACHLFKKGQQAELETLIDLFRNKLKNCPEQWQIKQQQATQQKLNRLYSELSANCTIK